MRAVIHRVEGRDGAGGLDIAGRPLLERQLQWLRDQGISEVAVELGECRTDVRLAEWLLGDDPLTHAAVAIPSAAPLGAAAVQARAGFDLETGVVHVPAHALCHVDLAPHVEAAQSCRLRPKTPGCPGAREIELQLCFVFGEDAPALREDPHGWGTAVEDNHGALRLGGMVLEGKLQGPLIHAAERTPGVWVGRGATISDDAQLTPPVLVGPGSYIGSHAKVGPLAVLHAGSVLERGTSVVESLVLEDTILSEGLQVRRSVAQPHALRPFEDSERISVAPSGGADPRTSPRSGMWGRLTAALLCVLLVIPWLLVATVALMRGTRVIEAQRWNRDGWLRRGNLGVAWLDVWPLLLDVAQGRRFLFGATDPTAGLCPAAFGLGSRLARDPQISLRMWPWYAFHKSGRLDRQLLTGGKSRV